MTSKNPPHAVAPHVVVTNSVTKIVTATDYIAECVTNTSPSVPGKLNSSFLHRFTQSITPQTLE